MQIKQIIVFKESRTGEGRVALTPDALSLLEKRNISFLVESDAGKLAQFSNQEYENAGARIFTLDTPIPSQSLILRVKCPSKEREILENRFISEKTAMIGFLDPLEKETQHIERWKSLGLSLIPLELLALAADDPKNAQAAMSHIAGRLALEDALNRYKGSHTNKVSVIGTGPAGLSAAFRARKLNLPVQLFGRKELYRQMLEEEGIQYFVLPDHEPREFLRQHLKDQTILITAARTLGKKAPLLIAETEFKLLPDHSVIVDLSAGEGGSVKGSKSDQVLTIDRHISIVNVSGYPKEEPQLASKAFSDCMVNLLLEIIQVNNQLSSNHPLLKGLVDYFYIRE